MNKKILTGAIISSFLVLGGSIAAVTTVGLTVLAQNPNEVIGKTVTWQAGNEAIKINDTTTVAVTSNAKTFELVGEIQKIEKVSLFGSTEEVLSAFKYQAGYKHGDKVIFTDIIENKTKTNSINFEAGKQPCKIKVTTETVDIATVEIKYNCINEKQDNYDAYPLDKGFYVVGSGSFVSTNRPVEWQPVGGLKICDEYWDKGVEKKATFTFKAGDEFKVCDRDMNDSNWFWIRTDADNPAFKNGYCTGGNDQNVKVEKDCTLEFYITPNDGEGHKNIWLNPIA